MTFFAAINCMDGRVQLPVIAYLRKRFEVDYVDTITEAGPIRILAQRTDGNKVRSILDRLRISFDRHSSKGIAVVGHHDCAGNPEARDVQISQIKESMSFLREEFPNTEIIGLYLDESWQVTDITEHFRQEE